MDKESFEIGALVILKSGGPQMVVERTGAAQNGALVVQCIWFAADGKLHQVRFLDVMLKLQQNRDQPGLPAKTGFPDWDRLGQN